MFLVMRLYRDVINYACSASDEYFVTGWTDIVNTIDFHYNAVQYNTILYTSLQWLNTNPNLNPQKLPPPHPNRRASVLW